MKRVFVTHKIPDSGLLLLKKQGYHVTIYNGRKRLTRSELIKKIKGFDALLCLLTDMIDGGVISAGLPTLKVISNYAVGYNNIDIVAAKDRNVIVTNTPDVLTNSVAEHTVALLLAVARRIVPADRFVRDGKFHGWQPELFLGTEISNKTLGIVGLGRIGSTVAYMAKRAFNMNILYHDISHNTQFEKRVDAKYATLPSLLQKSDFISLHVPLLPSTLHLINEVSLKSMKKNAFIINTSRGPIIDEKALVSALKSNMIAGAALDVFENEPKLSSGLKKLSNVILTPHIASATDETRKNMSEIAAQNIIAVLSGKEKNASIVSN